MTMDGSIDYGALVEQDETEGGFGIREMRVFDGKGYYVTVKLTEIHGATITEMEDDEGRSVRGVFIPFKGSGVLVTPKKNVLATFKMEACQLPSSHHSHLLTQVVDADVLRERRRLGYREGFVGFARPIGNWKKKWNKQ